MAKTITLNLNDREKYNHGYVVETETVEELYVYANNRTQAGSFAKKGGYVVRSMSMDF